MHDIAEFKRGTQILYVPNHADGDQDHPHVQQGFVTSVKEHTNTVFCRYWHMGQMWTLPNSVQPASAKAVTHCGLSSKTPGRKPRLTE